MPKIKIKERVYNITQEQLQEIQHRATSRIELKESVDWIPVAVYLLDNTKEILIGYLAGKIIDRIIERR